MWDFLLLFRCGEGVFERCRFKWGFGFYFSCFLLCFYRYTSALMLNTVHNLNGLWSANTIWTRPFLKSTWSWVYREVGENLGGVGAKGSKYILWDSQRLNKGIFKKIKYNANLFEILTSSTPFFQFGNKSMLPPGRMCLVAWEVEQF